MGFFYFYGFFSRLYSLQLILLPFYNSMSYLGPAYHTVIDHIVNNPKYHKKNISNIHLISSYNGTMLSSDNWSDQGLHSLRLCNFLYKRNFGSWLVRVRVRVRFNQLQERVLFCKSLQSRLSYVWHMESNEMLLYLFLFLF